MDRVVDFTFGMGDGRCHLIVELYAAVLLSVASFSSYAYTFWQGNIVLTDKDYKIVSLLRSYKLADETNVTVGVTYPQDIKQPLVHPISRSP